MALDRAAEQSIAPLPDAFYAGVTLRDRARKIARNLHLALFHRPESQP